jgi:hypothetical protein
LLGFNVLAGASVNTVVHPLKTTDMQLQYIGGPFDGLQIDGPPKGTVSMKPITQVHIGLAGGQTNIKSADDADRILQSSRGHWAIYVIDERNGIHGYHYLMDITQEEYAILGNDPRQTLRRLAESRGLPHPF